MKLNIGDAQKLLASRIEDHLGKADRGELVCGNFLTPSEAAFAAAYIKELGASNRFFLFGGYSEAERKRIFVLPSFLSDVDGEAEEKARTYFPDEMLSSIRAVRIQGSGYRTLSHRDYLGSLLALGIERSSLGDIAIIDDHSAVLFCTDKMFDFLIASIDRVASDKVVASEYESVSKLEIKREYLPINDTVASNRLDCIVGALTNLSREKAQTAIKSGLCEVNHLPEDRCDVPLSIPSTVSVRGYGKYDVLSFDGETKKGRLRIVARKYV
jgi:RNA-binding protein YlmH